MLSFCKIILGLRLMFRDNSKKQAKPCSEKAQEGTMWMRGLQGCRTGHPFGCLVAKPCGVKDLRTCRGYFFSVNFLSGSWLRASGGFREAAGCPLAPGGSCRLPQAPLAGPGIRRRMGMGTVRVNHRCDWTARGGKTAIRKPTRNSRSFSTYSWECVW